MWARAQEAQILTQMPDAAPFSRLATTGQLRSPPEVTGPVQAVVVNVSVPSELYDFEERIDLGFAECGVDDSMLKPIVSREPYSRMQSLAVRPSE